MISAIACVNDDWAIGIDNNLLYHFAEDMSHFKAYTKDKIIVMGRKTLLSLPNSKPLPGRINIVLANKDFDCPGAIVVHSLEFLREMLLQISTKLNRDVVIIGGGMLYSALLDMCDEIELTHVWGSIDDVSKNDLVYFPDLSKQKEIFKLDQEDTTCWATPWSTSESPAKFKYYRFETYKKIVKNKK